MIDAAAVRDALSSVRDPELDEPITELGFVATVEIDGDDVAVRMRLPTYFCAPNFAYLMVADARAALESLPGVARTTVELDDHFASTEINGAVAGRAGFAGAFPGETDGTVGELRTLFARKALLARQGRVCQELLDAGRSADEVVGLRLADLPQEGAIDRIRGLRCELGIGASPTAAAFVRPNGAPVTAEELPRWLRYARLVRVSLEGNGSLCRGLLRTRYGIVEVVA